MARNYNEYDNYKVIKKEIENLILPTIEATPTNLVAAQGTLTVDAQVDIGDTMTIGDTTYEFVANGDTPVEGEIELGSNLAGTQANIVDTINGDDTVNDANAYVTAGDFANDECVLTAITAGADGNDIDTTETFTTETNIFDDDTLGTTTEGTDYTSLPSDGVAGALHYQDDDNLYGTKADGTWYKIAVTEL